MQNIFRRYRSNSLAAIKNRIRISYFSFFICYSLNIYSQSANTDSTEVFTNCFIFTGNYTYNMWAGGRTQEAVLYGFDPSSSQHVFGIQKYKYLNTHGFNFSVSYEKAIRSKYSFTSGIFILNYNSKRQYTETSYKNSNNSNLSILGVNNFNLGLLLFLNYSKNRLAISSGFKVALWGIQNY